MKKKASIIPKFIFVGALLGAITISFLFFRPRLKLNSRATRSTSSEKTFAQVVQAALPQIQKIWEEGDQYLKNNELKCPDEIIFDQNVGNSYYQCQPHLWQCFWSQKDRKLKIDLLGRIYHLRARANFSPIPEYSSQKRYYEIIKGPYEGLNFHYGVLIELGIDEIPDFSWPVILTDTCRDIYLPQRIYAQGKSQIQKNNEAFLWDNFDRHIFVDKFYVTNQMINEWRILTGQTQKIMTNRKIWPYPALIDFSEQKAYCAFWGKRVMEAKLFDAATMTPIDLKNPLNRRVQRPQTPWQRDLSRTFLGMSRKNPDYQLTPLDCQLAQVQGCPDKYFTTDSVSWMGMNFALGFYPESLVNNFEPEKNIKLSSKFFPPDSQVHELGELGHWIGKQSPELPVAFRCYEEVSL